MWKLSALLNASSPPETSVAETQFPGGLSPSAVRGSHRTRPVQNRHFALRNSDAAITLLEVREGRVDMEQDVTDKHVNPVHADGTAGLDTARHISLVHHISLTRSRPYQLAYRDRGSRPSRRAVVEPSLRDPLLASFGVNSGSDARQVYHF